MNILRIDSSARYADSVTRDLATRLIERLNPDGTASIVTRDLAPGPSIVDEATVVSVFTPPEARTAEQVELLAEGAEMIEELRSTDTLVISMPMYNFAAPASLKAWADLVSRVGETFQYTETGPVGLLEDRPTYVIVTSGGTPIGGEMDWATGWLKLFLGFIGITNVTVIAGDNMNVDPEGATAAAQQAVADLALV